MKNVLCYDKKTFWRALLFLLGIVFAMKFTGGIGFVLFIPAMFYAFSKNRIELLLYLLLLISVLTVTNAYFAPKGLFFTLGARLAYGIIGGSMILQNIGKGLAPLVAPTLSLLFYLAYMALVSFLGWQPIVSELKIILFTVVFLSFFSVANVACRRQGLNIPMLRGIILAFATFFIIGSILLIPFPGISKMGFSDLLESSSDISAIGLFKGMTYHSQTMGPLAAFLAVFLLGDVLFSIKKMNLFYFINLVCAPILVYMSSSRTAMGAYLAGTFTLLFFFIQSRGMGAQWKNKVLSITCLLCIIGALGLGISPTGRSKVLSFAFKTYDNQVAKETVSIDNLISSRQGLALESLQNFRNSPFIGNGFQVSQEMKGRVYTSWKQLLSAPIEKGVWYSAILEEGGIFGMGLFLLFLLFCFYRMLTRHAYLSATMLFVFLICNLGEFNFFAMSADGAIFWALVFTSLCFDTARNRRSNVPCTNIQQYPNYYSLKNN